MEICFKHVHCTISFFIIKWSTIKVPGIVTYFKLLTLSFFPWVQLFSMGISSSLALIGKINPITIAQCTYFTYKMSLNNYKEVLCVETSRNISNVKTLSCYVSTLFNISLMSFIVDFWLCLYSRIWSLFYLLAKSKVILKIYH
jgi:hypothetical protein